MDAIVGYTGFVGSNICAGREFDYKFNSKNIKDAYGLKPDLLVYAGLRAEKFLANNAPERDYALIEEAEENIKRIMPKKLVLISTIDVYKRPTGVNEDSKIDTENLHPYGLNRYRLEQWVRENCSDALIIRLPALFGIHLKKNFLYDYIHVIPAMLKESKYQELQAKEKSLNKYYVRQDNGFYKCRTLNEEENVYLKAAFQKLGFTALNFTDSRSRFQFYPLSRLAGDIETALKYQLKLWNPATEPISAEEIYKALTGNSFCNELANAPADYDYRTLYADIFHGNGGYIMNKTEILHAIVEYCKEELQ